jgi:hypothetical protein
MDHLRSVELPPRNVQRCYAHVNMEKGDRAPSTGTSTGSKRTEKHPATPEHLKKRPGSSETTEVPKNLTSKRRRINNTCNMKTSKTTRPLICSILVGGRM